jgi:hypothetical protein
VSLLDLNRAIVHEEPEYILNGGRIGETVAILDLYCKDDKSCVSWSSTTSTNQSGVAPVMGLTCRQVSECTSFLAALRNAGGVNGGSSLNPETPEQAGGGERLRAQQEREAKARQLQSDACKTLIEAAALTGQSVDLGGDNACSRDLNTVLVPMSTYGKSDGSTPAMDSLQAESPLDKLTQSFAAGSSPNSSDPGDPLGLFGRGAPNASSNPQKYQHMRWDPPLKTFGVGQTASSTLTDDTGQKYVVLTVRWDRVRKALPNSNKYDQADFTIQVENRSSCALSTHAVLRQPGNDIALVVSDIDWQRWAMMNAPGPNESRTFQASFDFGQSAFVNTLELKPNDPDYSLWQCTN